MSARALGLAVGLWVAATTVAHATEPAARGGVGAYARLRDYAASRSGDVAYAIYDAHGNLATFHGKVKIRTASIIKVGVLAALLQAAADRGRPLTSREKGLAERMIRYSDNDATTALWGSLGRERIVAFLRSLGMTGTLPDPGDPYAWGYMLTTAEDMLLLMGKLYGHRIATPVLCRWGIELMTAIDPGQSWGLKSGIPPGAWIAFKNGWYPESHLWRVHSVGAIRLSGGAHYLMAVLTRYDVGLGMGYGMKTIAHLSRLAYRAQADTERVAANLRRAEGL